MTTEYMPRRPEILDEILPAIDVNTRKDALATAKKNMDMQMMDMLGNVRLQEDVYRLKIRAFEEAPEEISEREEKMRVEAIESSRMTLEDRYQAAEALALELQRVNAALKEMEEAGLAPLGNRSQRRAKRN